MKHLRLGIKAVVSTLSKSDIWKAGEDRRTNTIYLEQVLLLANEIDSLTAGGGVDESISRRLHNLELHPGDMPMLAGLWLRLGSLVTIEEFHSCWNTQELGLRSAVTRVMLEMQPEEALKLLTISGISVILEGNDDPRLHVSIAKAIAAGQLESVERCLHALSEEGQFILAPELAGKAGLSRVDTVPAWILQLPRGPRRAALTRFALGALGSGSEGTYVSAMERMDCDGLVGLSVVLETEISGLSLAGFEALVYHYHRMPDNPDLEIEICVYFILRAEKCQGMHNHMRRLASRLSDGDLRMLQRRAVLRAARLSEAQRSALSTLVGSVCAEATDGTTSGHGGQVKRGPANREDDQLDDLTELGVLSGGKTSNWNALTSRVENIQAPHRRAEALISLAPALSAEHLPAFGAIANELPRSEWQGEAKRALFAKALSLDLDPWSIVRGLDRRDALLALILHRIRRGRFDVFQHCAWLRLDQQHKTLALSIAIEEVALVEDEALRRKHVTALCQSITDLSSTLGAITAVQFVKRLDRDPAVASEHLWQLTTIKNLSSLHRMELMNVIATAYWLRGEDEAGDRCHEEAEAYLANLNDREGKRKATSTSFIRGGLDPERTTDAFAEDIRQPIWDREDSSALIAHRLATCDADQRARWVGRLILEGHAPALLLALETKELM